MVCFDLMLDNLTDLLFCCLKLLNTVEGKLKRLIKITKAFSWRYKAYLIIIKRKKCLYFDKQLKYQQHNL